MINHKDTYAVDETMERKVEDLTSKTQLKINRCTHRRLTIEHELGQQIRKQTYLSNQQFHKHREKLFHQKINHLKKTLEQTEPHAIDESNTNETMLAPNCSSRIQNHFRLLNFSSETEKRLLQHKSAEHLPNIFSRRNSSAIDQSIERVSLAQSRKSSARHQQQQPMFDEQIQQLKNDQRKASLLKEFDELKHTIDDPHSTYSVLAALSRAILFLDSGTE